MRITRFGLYFLLAGVAATCGTILFEGTSFTTPAFAADEPTDDVVQMTIQLLADHDKDLRAVGMDQVRSTAKGSSATKQFAAQLSKLPATGQTALLSALADRGDSTALPSVRELLGKSGDESVRAAAIVTIGSLGKADDLSLLVKSLSSDSATEKKAARVAITRLRGEDVPTAIAAVMKGASPAVHVALIEILADRRALATVGSMVGDTIDESPQVRMAAMVALGQMAGAEQIPGMLAGVLKAPVGAERDAAEKAIALVGSRIEDANKVILSAWSKAKVDDQTALLPALGRVGGMKIHQTVEDSMGSDDRPRREAGLAALCNWPDASVADELFSLAQKADTTAHRDMTFGAFVRVGSNRDDRTDLQRLDRMKQAMSITKSDEERLLVLDRCRSAYAIESLRYLLPYLSKPQFTQVVCESIVELAHHREIREPNKSEFDPALDQVIQLSKDAVVIDRANRYKKGETWERPKPADAAANSP